MRSIADSDTSISSGKSSLDWEMRAEIKKTFQDNTRRELKKLRPWNKPIMRRKKSHKPSGPVLLPCGSLSCHKFLLNFQRRRGSARTASRTWQYQVTTSHTPCHSSPYHPPEPESGECWVLTLVTLIKKYCGGCHSNPYLLSSCPKWKQLFKLIINFIK